MSNERIVRDLTRAKLSLMALIDYTKRDRDNVPEEALMASCSVLYIQRAIDELSRVGAH